MSEFVELSGCSDWSGFIVLSGLADCSGLSVPLELSGIPSPFGCSGLSVLLELSGIPPPLGCSGLSGLSELSGASELSGCPGFTGLTRLSELSADTPLSGWIMLLVLPESDIPFSSGFPVTLLSPKFSDSFNIAVVPNLDDSVSSLIFFSGNLGSDVNEVTGITTFFIPFSSVLQTWV